MNKIFFISISVLIVLSEACSEQSIQTAKIANRDAVIKMIEQASEYVAGMEYKGLEAVRASTLFEEYKKLKLAVIRKALLGEDYVDEVGQLKELKIVFNLRITNITHIDYSTITDRQNPYFENFEYNFIRTFINSAPEGLVADLSKLQIVFND